MTKRNWMRCQIHAGRALLWQKAQESESEREQSRNLKQKQWKWFCNKTICAILYYPLLAIISKFLIYAPNGIINSDRQLDQETSSNNGHEDELGRGKDTTDRKWVVDFMTLFSPRLNLRPIQLFYIFIQRSLARPDQRTEDINGTDLFFGIKMCVQTLIEQFQSSCNGEWGQSVIVKHVVQHLHTMMTPDRSGLPEFVRERESVAENKLLDESPGTCLLLSCPKSHSVCFGGGWLNGIRAKTINSLGAELRFGAESDTSFYS